MYCSIYYNTRIKPAYILYIIICAKLTLLIKISPIGLTCLYA